MSMYLRSAMTPLWTLTRPTEQGDPRKLLAVSKSDLFDADLDDVADRMHAAASRPAED
ncbi:hypothetical protein [Flexivirga alba]|uniref:Uncharacterized protein n=1 Tax=Flexivirga alba TaxID=702742 RepID=A0ABW2AIV6_9MICO